VQKDDMGNNLQLLPLLEALTLLDSLV